MGIILFDEKTKCCACGACKNICPKGAIELVKDKEGFLYPQIDKKKCVECGACKRVCEYQNVTPNNTPKMVFAGVNKQEEQLMKSASGGIFSAIATKFLKDGGVVFGATLSFENEHAVPQHIFIDNIKELPRLQGSKYVQSDIGNTYSEAKKMLNEGKKILFSGTPCQIGGLYGFLGKDYENLFTIDVICHGVPNASFFDDYIQNEKNKRNAKSIIGYSFRDKQKGWGMNGKITYIKQDGLEKNVYVPARLNSYNTLFLDGMIYRENCYVCKYAKQERRADMTIGDYWGIEIEHPELLGKKGYNEKKGISCILANTEKGLDICNNLRDLVQMDESSFEKVSHKNGQLNEPSKKPVNREMILEKYAENGYLEVEEWFKKAYKKQIIVHTIYNAIPRKLRLKLKKIIKG